MGTEYPWMPFDNDELTVVPDSQLDTLAHLNPIACVRYADQLLQELDDAMATCTFNATSVSFADIFEQIHVLKSMVSPTGCRPLLDACVALQSQSASGTHRTELCAAFKGIAEAARRLISAYRSQLVASNPT